MKARENREAMVHKKSARWEAKVGHYSPKKTSDRCVVMYTKDSDNTYIDTIPYAYTYKTK